MTPSQEKGILASIVRFSLRSRGIVIALSALFLGYGLYGLTGARYDVFPEFAPPSVTISAEAPGLSPEQVEELVTRPIETAVNTVAGIESLRSTSIQGLSVTTARFRPGTDIATVRQAAAERLASAVRQLPQGVTPVVTPLTSSTGTVLLLGLTSETRTPMELRTIADWIVGKALLAVPGVAKIAVYGGEVKELQIQLEPDRLSRYNLSFDDVIAVSRKATAVKGAGFIDTGNQRIVLFTAGQSLTPQQIGDTVLGYKEGTPVSLRDAATVAEAPAPRIGSASIMGNPGVVLVVSAQYGANTITVTKGLEAVIGGLAPALRKEGVVIHPDLFRPADFIEAAIRNVKTSLLVGAFLVAVVLFLFLFNLRAAAISCTAIPLSLLAAVAILQHMGFSLNTMTLGGLAIAIGEVVDDAVIDVENIFRRLRENRLREEPLPAIGVIFAASIEVRSAVVYATFAVMLVFVPIVTLSGVAGRIFAPLGIAYILAIFSSLLVALSVTPALCLVLFGRRPPPEKEPPFIHWLKGRYRKFLVHVDGHPGAVAAVVSASVLVILVSLPFLEGEFLPALKEGNFIVHVSAIPGTSMDESLRIGKKISDMLARLPFVRSVHQLAGRAEEGDEPRGTNSSEIGVALKTSESLDLDAAKSTIRKTLSRFPGITVSINTFLKERMEETISGYAAPLAINIYGEDLDTLNEEAQKIAAVVGGIRGAANVRLQSPPETPQLRIRLKKDELVASGFDPVSVLTVVGAAYRGERVGQIYEDNKVFNVSVILDPAYRRSVIGPGDLLLRNSGGTYVPLRLLADISETPGRYSVLHNGGRRVQSVTCAAEGRSDASFVAEVKKRLASVTLPAGTYREFAGTALAQSKAATDLLVHAVLAGAGIVLLLSVVLNYRNLLLVLLNLPFALAGGVVVVLLSGGRLSTGSLVGFVTLFGITLRNSIMLISHYEHLVAVEGSPWGLETALRGAIERLAPILMTATVTALGLLPLALASGTAGREIEGPMAQVILGGLLTSTVLNLLVLPTLALRYGRFEKKKV